MTDPSGNSEFCFPLTSMFPLASPRGTLRISDLLICSDTCLWTLSVLRSQLNSFLIMRASLKENCELRGTDNVQGQITELIFASNGG